MSLAPMPQVDYGDSSITSTQTLVSDKPNVLSKRGSIVCLDCWIECGSSTPAGPTIGQIPAGYRPKNNIRITSLQGTQATGLYINSNGVIQNMSDLSNKTVVIHATWVID